MAVVTSAVVLALSVVVPTLDSGADFAGPGIESEHHASTCVVVHDHTICTQVSANRALTTHAAAPRRAAAELVLPDPAPTRTPSDSRRAGTRLPRAPPFHRA